MEIREETENGLLVLVPVDRIDGNTAQGFADRIAEVAKRDVPAVILDFSELNYISSTGLRSVLMLAKTSKAAGKGMAVCALAPHIREVFDVSGFSRILTLADDRPAALAQLS